jgi:molybdopterin-guanine dinucleotide biosynthesis protein A
MTLSAVLLAGGKSRRMGQDKATLLFRERPLWQTQIDLLRKLQPEQILVSAQTNPGWRPSNVGFAADARPSRGPLSGIAAALSQITSDHLLALAIDMPFISNDYLRRLREQCRPGCGVVPMIDNRAEPLAAIYPLEAQADFHAALSGDDFSLQSLVARLVAAGKLKSIPVSEEEAGLFRNLNEPRDVAGS